MLKQVSLQIRRMLADIEAEVHLTRSLTGRDSLDARVMQAMKQVPRHQFVPPEAERSAYINGPVPIGHGQTISQPFMVAVMTDLLAVGPDAVILEIGTGSGYQAAILSQLVRKVYSIEIIEPLAQAASTRLQRLHCDNVEIGRGDGYFGWPEHAPFDGILITAAAPCIPQPLVDQLKAGAKLVLPLGDPFSYQELVLVEKQEDGTVHSRTLFGVAFVPLTGVHDGVAGRSITPCKPPA